MLAFYLSAIPLFLLRFIAAASDCSSAAAAAAAAALLFEISKRFCSARKECHR